MSRGDGNDLVTVSGLVLLKETDKALGVAVVSEMQGHQVSHWLPKSMIDARRGLDAFGEVGECDLPRWLAEKNSLEYEE